VLEEKVAEAYEKVASSIESPVLRAVFRFIAADSLKHAKVFEEACELAEASRPPAAEDCERALGKAWSRILEGAKELEASAASGPEELARILGRAASLESFVGEEYLQFLASKFALEKLAEEEKAKLGPLVRLVEYVVEDESRHANLLEEARRFLESKAARSAQGD